MNNRLKTGMICSLLLACLASLTAHGQFDDGRAYRHTDLPAYRHTDLIVPPPSNIGPRMSRIASIFVDQCMGCHNEQQAEGGYSMATPEALWKPGDSKQLPITKDPKRPNDEAWGELYRRLVTNDPSIRMPKDSEPLDQDSQDAILEWLAYGAIVDGAVDAPLESFVPQQLSTEPKWNSYPRPHAVASLAVDAVHQVLFASGAYEVLAWSMDGKLLGRIPVRGRFVSDIEWNGVAERLYVCSGTPGQLGFVESVAWSHETGDTNEALRVAHWVARDVPLDCAISPAGDRLAVGLLDGSILVQDAYSNSTIWRSAAHAAAVTSVDWSQDGKHLVTSSRDRMAKSFEAQKGDVVTSFADHERTVASVRSLSLGCVTMDEAGVLRMYPGGTSSNSRASRGGFAQRTPKMASDRELVVIPVEGQLRRFQFRTEEVDDGKDKEGKEKKKRVWIIDELPRLSWATTPGGPSDQELPLCVVVANGTSKTIAAGFVDGTIFLWRDDASEPIRLSNQVP